MPDLRLTKRVKRWFRYWAIRLALAIVGRLPLESAGALGERFGSLAFLLASSERRKALDSLSRAFPDRTEPERVALARESFRHLGRSLFELACVNELDRELERRVEWPVAEQALLRRVLDRKRGVVFVSGHVGNWELLARRVAFAGFPCSSIARETSDPRLTKLIESFRLRGNVRSIWRGQPGAAKHMLRTLRSGEILGLVIDQDTRVQSVFVPFFGALASTPRAAADLALKTGAAVVAGFCQRQPDGRYRLSLSEVPVPESRGEESVLALTRAMTAEIEAAIRRAPAQWVWMHRRWKTQPMELVP